MFILSKLAKEFLIITFAIMILLWGLCVILGINGITLEDHAWLYIPYIVGGFSPTIASYIALKRNGEISGFKDWLKHVFDVKHGILSYIMAIILPVIFFIPLCLLSGYDKGEPLYMIFAMIPVMLLGGGLEEAGWRYILFPELDKKYDYLISVIVVGIIWWIWHLPLFFIPGVAQYQTDFLLFGIRVIGMSFATGCIRKTTDSVFLCVLFHCIINSLYGIYMPKESYIETAVAIIIGSLVSWGLVLINKKRLVFH